MLSRKKSLLASVVVSLSLVGMAWSIPVASLSSPEGYWKTVDDVSGKPKSIIKIWRSPTQSLMGKIVRLFPKAGEDVTHKVCTACSGELHNQPMVGMVILSGLKKSDKQWVDGKILDPANGKTYACNVRLTANGEKLQVRGYIGMSLFGRSQTWERVDLLSG